jgi:perosamine synthetase
MYALGISPGDEVIVPAITFAATANCVVFQGGTPVFTDVDPETLLIDIELIEARITPFTRAVVAVDYAGQPCDSHALQALVGRHGLALVADACHSLGGSYKGRTVGSLANLSAFSFHPVKHITTGEGGMITTDDPDMVLRMRRFRNHGIDTDFRERAARGSWFYEMVDLGYNYRLTDIQCALGLSQLKRLRSFVARRQEIAHQYDEAFEQIAGVTPLTAKPHVSHAYHLYVVRLDTGVIGRSRDEVFRSLRDEGIGVNVHYIPVHLHPYYHEKFGTMPGLCPVAEAVSQQIISLPIFPRMTDDDVHRVIDAVRAQCS